MTEANVDFPEPETPVIQVIPPIGKETFCPCIFLKFILLILK